MLKADNLKQQISQQKQELSEQLPKFQTHWNILNTTFQVGFKDLQDITTTREVFELFDKIFLNYQEKGVLKSRPEEVLTILKSIRNKLINQFLKSHYQDLIDSNVKEANKT